MDTIRKEKKIGIKINNGMKKEKGRKKQKGSRREEIKKTHLFLCLSKHRD
jgi:hypothetical protein